jgi:preprotein translocase SecE subunit
LARDRQRAKQRRRRTSGSAGTTGRPRPTRARDIGLDEASVEDAGLGATPAPDPLKHSSADLDEALLAEAGAIPPDFADEARAPDELEEPAALATAPTAAPERRRGGNRVFNFLRNSWEELRRVQWPDRRQVAQGTAVVLGFVILAGSYLGLLDAIWKPIIQAIL